MGEKNTYQAQANELSQTLWAIANELQDRWIPVNLRIIF